METQYRKASDAEIERMKKLQSELEAVLKDEETLITQLLEQSKDSHRFGVTAAEKCYKDIQAAFCEEQEAEIQNAVMQKVRAEFPSPESANIKAYQNSFEISNYVNVVKYVLNINKFIRELYDERIGIIAKSEIMKRLESQESNFVQVIKETMIVVKKWSTDNQHQTKTNLLTLFEYAKKNQTIKDYFPDLYTVQINEINTFAKAFTKRLALYLEKSNISKEINDAFYKKVEGYLQNQYKILTGCQARCPICNNKCIKSELNHKDHHTNPHLLTSFTGVRDTKDKKVTLNRCFDTHNYLCTWKISGGKYIPFDEFLNSKYPEWRTEFPTKEQTSKHEHTIPIKIIECWVAAEMGDNFF